MTDESFPTFEVGDTVSVDGESYTVSSLDPDPGSPDGVRAYYLESGEKESIRLEPRLGRRKWALVRVASYSVGDVEEVA